MIALLFTNLYAVSRRLKKKPSIKWKGRLMNLISSVLAVASFREVVPLQTRWSGLASWGR
jgi:hypothetical protein